MTIIARCAIGKAITLPLLAALLLLTGCVKSGRGAEALKPLDVPYDGTALKDNFWQAVSDDTSGKPLLSTKSFTWPFPFYSTYYNEFGVDRERQRATSFRATWNDILFPIVALPMRATVEEHAYGRPNLEPVGKKGFKWNLFYTKAWNEGTNYSDMNYKAAGVPLFYSRVGLESFDGSDRLTVRNILWTLGPVWALGKSSSGGESLQLPGFERGYFFAPLFVGGLGAIVWSDYSRRDADGDFFAGHGPFLGFLGYHSMRKTHAENPKKEGEAGKAYIQKRRLVLGGILWQDRSRATLEGEVYNAGHGPLWGMFGWGMKQGAPTIQFLWMPIKVGSAKQAAAE